MHWPDPLGVILTSFCIFLVSYAEIIWRNGFNGMKTFASATSRSKPIVYVSSHFGENLTRINEGSTLHRILFIGSV